MARLAPGVTSERALAQILPAYRHAAYAGVPQAKQGSGKPPILSFSPAKQFGDSGDSQTKSLQTLMTMVVLVLLIAISNVVMLLMARNANRQREFSIRLSLGAGRKELARQLLVESFLLVTTGGVVAWLFAASATRALASWAQIDTSLEPDSTVLWFTLAVLMVAALIFGLAPLRSAMTNDPQMTLKSSNSVSQHNTQKVRAGNAVIVTQVALCVVLLVGAGLLFGTLRNLINTPLGMKAEGLFVFGVHPKHFNSPEAGVAFYQTLQQRLSAQPGVTAVSMAENRPGSGWSNNNGGFLIDGHKPNGLSADDTSFRNNGVGSNYFHTMGVHLVAGRDFTDADTATSPKVIVINETFAKRYLAPGNAVGHILSDPDQKDHFQIIGVVQDHKYTGITEQAMPMLWNIFTQGNSLGELNYEVRVHGDPMTLLEPARRLAAQMDPYMPLLQPMTQSEQFTLSISQQIMFARLAGCFGALAVVLIATGLYGTLSYRVSKRSAEIGVRMALGAQRSQVVWMVLRGSLWLTAGGVLLGVPLAMAACRGLESSLYGIRPLDPASYALAIAGVALVALLASAIPAGRAASVDPSRALRAD
jgi:predicted permease